MADTHPEVVFFWLPGCGNCTHLRGYLTARGVVHRAVNVVAEPDALAAISDPAHRVPPFLLVGGQWVAGDEAAIEAALRLPAAEKRADMPPHMLIERCARMLELSSALAGQLPTANYGRSHPNDVRFSSCTAVLRGWSTLRPAHNVEVAGASYRSAW